MLIFVESNSSALIQIEGPDARDFLHRLTTTHVNALSVGECSSGFFLNAQGKIQAFFGIKHSAPNSYLMDVPKGASEAWKAALLTTIDRFTFAEKISVKEIQRNHYWALDTESSNLNTLEEKLSKITDITTLNWGKTPFGVPALSIFGDSQKIESLLGTIAKKETLKTLDEYRIENIRPGIDHEIVLESNPLEIGMRGSIADSKGCYPGQEVIEKIISLGSPAKGLVQIEIESPHAPHLGEKITALDGTEIGKVTSAIQSKGKTLLLAILRKTHLKPGIEIRLPDSNLSGKITQLAETHTS